MSSTFANFRCYFHIFLTSMLAPVFPYAQNMFRGSPFFHVLPATETVFTNSRDLSVPGTRITQRFEWQAFPIDEGTAVTYFGQPFLFLKPWKGLFAATFLKEHPMAGKSFHRKEYSMETTPSEKQDTSLYPVCFVSFHPRGCI